MPGRIIELIKGKKYKVIVEAGKNPENGNRKRVVRIVNGRKYDAELLYSDIVRELEQGIYIEPKKTTLAEYLREWLNSYAKNKAPSTYAGYKRIVESHIIPKLGSLRLAKIQPMHIQGYYTNKLQEGRRDGTGGLSATTVRRHHALLREALQHAVKWKYINRNPADDTEPPVPERAEIYPLSDSQLDKLLSLAAGRRDEYLFTVAAYTGMREGEILALAWDSVNLGKNPFCRVQRTVGYINKQGFVFRNQGKSKKARREIPLPDIAVTALKMQKKMIAQEKLKAGKRYVKGSNLVFPGPLGKPLDPSGVSRRFKALAVKAGAPNARFHDLRHSFATMMLEQGEHPRIVQELLGHQTIGITMDTYSHVSAGMQGDAIGRLNEKLKNKDGHKTGTFEEK